MGTIYKKINDHIVWVNPDTDVFVEIGSERGEGSTRFFAELAVENNTVVHTVDINPYPQTWLTLHGVVDGIVWHQGHGSSWAKEVFPTLKKQISILYLDNFDYNYNTVTMDQMILDQQQDYLEKFGIAMTNQNCQIEHMKQMISLLPYMHDRSMIICDDTYQYNDCWIGKCGPVVVFLLANGWTILDNNPESGHGVILTNH